MTLSDVEIFDSHLHIIDPDYPLIPNNGYLPDSFTVADYRNHTASYRVTGGAVVSGSFQGFDQDYLVNALLALGPNYVGVTQIPHDTSDEAIMMLHQQGVRALRFNLYRGGSEALRHLPMMAQRVYDVAGWHTELYVDGKDLQDLSPTLMALPAISIDHLGLTKAGLPALTRLAGQGVHVKATGFGRVDFDVTHALQELYHANPDALIFGTDLPSTRAPRPFQKADIDTVLSALGERAARQVFYDNAKAFYHKKPVK